MLTQGSLGWMGSTFSRLLVWRQGSIMLCQNFHFQSVLIDHMDICAFNRAAGTTLMKAPKKNWCVVWFFILFFSWVRQIIKFIIFCPQVGSTVPHTVYEIKAIMSTMDRGRDYAKVRRLTLWYYITRTSKPEWSMIISKGTSWVTAQYRRRKENSHWKRRMPCSSAVTGSCTSAPEESWISGFAIKNNCPLS